MADTQSNRRRQACNIQNLKFWGLSLFNALVLLVVCYMADNSAFFISNGLTVGQKIEQARAFLADGLDGDNDAYRKHSANCFLERYFMEWLSGDEDSILKDYELINVAYDRELISVIDQNNFPKGNIDITDRKKLTDFISQTADAHKYIILDVRLARPYSSPHDSALIEAILRTNRIAVACAEGSELLDPRLNSKAFFTDYSVDILQTDFMKYEFVRNGQYSMAYKTYIDLTGEKPVEQYGPFYMKDGKLYWKSLIQRFPVKLWNSSVTKNKGENITFSEDKILNLGSDMLDMGMNIPDRIKGKIVIIGDYTEDDIHTTYIGKIAGPVIHLNALNSLLNNETEVPWWLIVIIGGVYTVITYILIKRVRIFRVLQRLKMDRPVVHTLISFVGLSTLFAVMAGIIYLSTGKDINVFIPAVWFTGLQFVIDKRWKQL